MAQWDVFANPSARTRDDLPYLVVLQSDLLDSLTTRLVAPLARRPLAAQGLPRRLAPTFEVAGEPVFMLPQEAGPIDARLLRRMVVNLSPESHRLIEAMDAVISGI